MRSFWKYLGIDINIKNSKHFRDQEVQRVKELLQSSKICISDIICGCQRTDLRSPADKDLTNVIPNVLIFEKLTITDSPIRRIIFTSGDWDIKTKSKSTGVFANKKSAVSLFFETLALLKADIFFKVDGNWLEAHGRMNCEVISNLTDKINIQVKWKLKGKVSPVYDLVLLPSPSSSANTNLTNTTKFKRWVVSEFGPNALNFLNELNEQMKGKTSEEKKMYGKSGKLGTKLKSMKPGKFNGESDYREVYRKDLYSLAFSLNGNYSELPELDSIQIT